MKNEIVKEKSMRDSKSPKFGQVKSAKAFGQVSTPKYNGQCKKAGTRDANEVQYK